MQTLETRVHNVRKRFPKSRTTFVAHQLLVDIAALLSHLRPGFLLDYAVLYPEELHHIILDIVSPQFASDLAIVVLHDGCCLVVNKQTLPDILMHPPMFIEFTERHHNHGGLLVPAWMAAGTDGTATATDTVSAKDRLQASVRSILTAGTAIVQHGTNTCKDGGLTMPTLNGCLLGYPVSYVVNNIDHAQAASRCLSTTTLRLFTVKCTFGGLDEEMVLMSFSVPTAMVGGGGFEERKKAWIKRLKEKHREAIEHRGMPWGRMLRVEETVCDDMRGIAL